MRYKSQDGYVSFEPKLKGNNIIIIVYARRKKISEETINIKEYLNNDTEFQRRQFIFEKDINGVKRDSLEYPLSDRHLDLVHKVITETLKKEGLFTPTLAEMVDNRSKERGNSILATTSDKGCKTVK